MPPAKKIDNKKLLKAVKDGMPQKEIMKEFGFKTSTQLKVAIANAAMETGKLPQLKSGRGPSGPDEISDEISVNKRGSLVIPKKLAEKLGLKVGEKFKVRKSASGVSLKDPNKKKASKK